MLLALVGLTAFMLLQPSAKFELTPQTKTSKFHSQLDTIVDTVNSMKTSWTATAYPKWKTMTFDELKNLNGALTPPKTSEFQLPVVSRVANDIPAEFDSATAWPGCDSINEIRDQANCGSCWAFGAAEAITDRYCIASGQKDHTRISMENLLDCCTTCGFGCGGGYTIRAW